MRTSLFILSLFYLFSCQANNTPLTESQTQDVQSKSHLQTAYFASGCFWCVEAVFESVRGVEEAVSGYAGGTTKNPTYRSVSSGDTDHAESVMVYYDSTIVSFETLVDVFFASHDPTTLNQQGPDRGAQYRSIAFYQNAREKAIIERKIDQLLKNKTFPKITTQVQKFTKFYKAEDYHQNYERLHPNEYYVRNVSIPRLNKFKAKMPEVLK